jgi:hypothetical protein
MINNMLSSIARSHCELFVAYKSMRVYILSNYMQDGVPRYLSCLISGITMVYGRYNYNEWMLMGFYKPTYNWGTPSSSP